MRRWRQRNNKCDKRGPGGEERRWGRRKTSNEGRVTQKSKRKGETREELEIVGLFSIAIFFALQRRKNAASDGKKVGKRPSAKKNATKKKYQQQQKK